ncbi:MAG: hypothetical protein ACP5JP_05810 [bacterium]
MSKLSYCIFRVKIINQTGTSISIGKNSYASCYLESQSNVEKFLEWIL